MPLASAKNTLKLPSLLKRTAFVSTAIFVGSMVACSGYNPNHGYAKNTKTIAATVLPPGSGATKLVSNPFYPVPSSKGMLVNPTVSVEPPGSELAKFRRPGKYRNAQGAKVSRQVTYYFSKGSNNMPLLMLGIPAQKSWNIVAAAIAKTPYRIAAKDRSLETYMLTLPTKSSSPKSSLPLYALHVYPQGKKQTVLSLSENKQGVASSKNILQTIAEQLP